MRLKTTVYLGSNIVMKDSREIFRQFFSLVYIDKKEIHIDLKSFRPSINILPMKKYNAELSFHIETDEDGKDIKFLDSVKIGKDVFIKIR